MPYHSAERIPGPPQAKVNHQPPTPAGLPEATASESTASESTIGPPNRRIAVLAYDGLCTFEFGIAVEVFGLPRPEFGERWYEFLVCGVGAGPYRATGGITVAADAGLEALEGAGTIVIPGWRHPDEPPPAELLDALRRAHGRGARILSICSGVFVLAAAGLLSGLRATTHWRYTDRLQARHPDIRVEPGVLYIDNGTILTSAGSAAGLDLALHLVRRDYGPRIANQVAKRLVIPPHRDGGQSQFIERPLPDREGSHFGRLIAELRADLSAEHTVAEMARRAAMSERTFLRRFKEATGASPADWLTGERVGRARELLEGTSLPMEEIAASAGFANAAAMRHHFHRKLGVTPARYRAAFLGEAS
nr:transcriptional regulator FtrA [Azospirillum sp. SYSU D00513]